MKGTISALLARLASVERESMYLVPRGTKPQRASLISVDCGLRYKKCEILPLDWRGAELLTPIWERNADVAFIQQVSRGSASNLNSKTEFKCVLSERFITIEGAIKGRNIF